MDAILRLSEGDMRKSITFLQSVHRLQREDGIMVEDIYEIAGVSIPPETTFDPMCDGMFLKVEGQITQGALFSPQENGPCNICVMH